MFIDTDSNRKFTQLTAKQREAIELYADGLTVKEQARKLGITPSAIEQRLTAAQRKLGISDRSEIKWVYPQSGNHALTQDEHSLVVGAIRPREPLKSRLQIDDTLADVPVRPGTPPFSPSRSQPNGSRFSAGFVLGFLSGLVLASACYVSSLWSVLRLMKSVV
jgi:DNA-binding CsgD family transcriptional regulator